MRRRFCHAVIGHGGRADEHIQGVDRGHCGGHVLCGFNANELNTRRGRQRRNSADEGNARAGADGGFGQRVAHFSGGTIADEAHRVDRFARAARRDDEVLPAPVHGGGKGLKQARGQFFGFEQPPGADIAAGLHAIGRCPHGDAARA